MFAIANDRKSLWQWDLNQQLTVAGDCTEVHYLDRGAPSTLTVAVKDGKADIPNILLQKAGRLVVYAYIIDAQDHHTKVCETFGIAPRPKPAEYVYTETEVKTWSDLQSQIGDLDNLVTEEKNNLVAAINEAARSGGGAGAWYVTLTPNDDGSITADKTMEEIEAAYQSGYAVYCIILYSAIFVIVPVIAPLTIHRANEQYTFCGVGTFDGKLYSFQFELTKSGWTVLQKEIPQKSDIPAAYILPKATANALGGVKADPATADDTQPVRIDDSGKLVTAAGDTDISLGLTSAAVGQTIKVKAIDESGKPTEWEAADMPSGGVGTKTEEVTETVTVGSENITLDSTAPSQAVNLAWNLPGSKIIPSFTNYYSNLNGKTYPRELGGGYNQFWSFSAGHGNADAFDSAHKYFMALKYELDGDSTAHFESSTDYITPTNSTTLSGSGWIYTFGKITSESSATWYINRLSGTGRVYYVYCIDVTALQEAGTITATTINELAELFGGLELIPGQNYEGSTTSGMATLSITRDGETTTVESGTTTATVQGGDILSVEGGSVTFLLKVLREVYVDPIKVWSGKKWVAFGDSLTDESINADKKYYRYIEEKTGITVTVMGKGGTGYYKTYDSGTAYGQRMARVPADADVITIFGSVNDWHTQNAGVAMGNASDTMEAGTLAGYINECIDVAIEKAPYAQIALVTPMDYHGPPDDTLEGIANIIKAVAAYRKIKCLDLYHESGFRVDNPTFAAVYTTDYSETAESYGHPSNLAHEQLIAPEFMQLLKRMILTV